MSSSSQERPSSVTAANVDLSNCDRELIQYSGAVQLHSALVVLSQPDLTIVQISANSESFFQKGTTDLIGVSVEQLLGSDQTETLRGRLQQETLDNVPPVHILRAAIAGREFHVFAHRIDGVILLELEPASPERPIDVYSRVRAAISRLHVTPTLQIFLDAAVKEIRDFTGFDRVMAYEFLPDGSGRVVSESVAGGFEPFLGLHYPPSDIPQPARRLFALTWLPHLPDVDYEPVPLIPATNLATNGALDLSYVAGRHVSVMYTKYLQNMGVKATLVLTLLKQGKLWGLVSCMNHTRPMHVPYETRMSCEFLAHTVSLLMASKQDAEHYEQRLRTDAIIRQIMENVAKSSSFEAGLTKRNPQLAEILPCGGAAVVRGPQVTAVGNTPQVSEIRELAKWLLARETPLYATDKLTEDFPAANSYQKVASGLLAICLARTGPDLLLWFRPEIGSTVAWAGDPGKPVEVSTLDRETRLQPRTSFAVWKQEVRGRSAPWREWEVEAIRSFRQALMEIIVEKARELERLNLELGRSNLELDSFAYAASHDLKEPLRGIHNYSALLQRSASERLNDSERARLETVLRLTQRMDDLIESLLQYSRLGRMELALHDTDLNEVVRSALDMLRARIESFGAQLAVAALPTVRCDRIRVREVFCNLILNAIKYNDKTERIVEIGCEPGPTPRFYVRDNGIGIETEHIEDIFQIFKRLHGRDEYGGGTGVGLTIARRAVERHGGRMWVISEPERGSTFYFTLGQSAGVSGAEPHE